MTKRQWLTVEEKEACRSLIRKCFEAGMIDREIAEKVTERGFRGVWNQVRINVERKRMGLRKGFPLPPENAPVKPLTRGPASDKGLDAEIRETEAEGGGDSREVENPSAGIRREKTADPDPLPPIQKAEYTLRDLILKIKQLVTQINDTLSFAEKVQDDFSKKGGSIFF